MSVRPQNKYLKPFKPGQSGNPSGKPKQLLTKDKVSSIFQKFSCKNRIELQAVIDDQKSTMIEIMVASVMVKAAKEGDYARVQFLLDRAVGKVPNENINENLNANIDKDQLIDRVPVETVIEMVKSLPDSTDK